MAGELHEAQAIVETIQPAIALLGLGIGAALASRALKLNPIVGYIGLGLAIGMLGYSDLFSGPVVAAMAEAGIMFLLFNLGLHFSLGRIRDEAGSIFGFGALQMAIAGGGFGGLFWLLGAPTELAVLGGLAMGLSSTAVVIGLVRERDQEDCPVGRAAQAILIFQDIVAIMLLVAASALSGEGALVPALLDAGWKAAAAFAIAVLFAKFLTERLFRLISRTRSSEVYTATALFVALAAGWATGVVGLSLTLGAFLGGVAVADSRYRMMVQTEIDAFRGLFLSFFFISVGLGIDAQVLSQYWLVAIVAAIALVALKCLFNVLAGLANRWSVPGSIQLGFLLGQGSEFALVLFAIPAVAALAEPRVMAVLVTAIAISMATTPMISNIGRKIAGKLRSGPADRKLDGDDARVMIIGLGPAGRAVADALAYNRIDHIAVESDHERFESALADGYGVHHAHPGDPRSWEALGLSKREVVLIATGNVQISRDLHPLVEERLPAVTRIVVLPSADAVGEFEELGIEPVVVDGEGGYERVVTAVFDALGEQRARPVPSRAHDEAALKVA